MWQRPVVKSRAGMLCALFPSEKKSDQLMNRSTRTLQHDSHLSLMVLAPAARATLAE